jgi:hypothetical protein
MSYECVPQDTQDTHEEEDTCHMSVYRRTHRTYMYTRIYMYTHTCTRKR